MSILNLEEIEDFVEKVIPYKCIKIDESDITLEMLYEAEKIMAQITKKYGNEYLPAFIKIHKEIKHRKIDFSYEKIALHIANDSLI